MRRLKLIFWMFRGDFNMVLCMQMMSCKEPVVGWGVQSLSTSLKTQTMIFLSPNTYLCLLAIVPFLGWDFLNFLSGVLETTNQLLLPIPLLILLVISFSFSLWFLFCFVLFWLDVTLWSLVLRFLVKCVPQVILLFYIIYAFFVRMFSSDTWGR